VLTEIEAVAKRVRKIHLLDPDLPSTRRWTETFCRELIRRGISIRWRSDLRLEDAKPGLLELFRASGCEEVLITVETLDQNLRDKVGEGCTTKKLRQSIELIRDTGIRPILFFYIGLPWDSAQSLAKIQRFLHDFPVASFYFKQVRPWPGTPVNHAFKSFGLLNRELTATDFVNSGSPLCPTLYLSEEELEEWKRQIGRTGIFQPAFLWRFLKERRLRPKHIAQFTSLLLGKNIFKGK
jgi:radical SAM superfamily enzyme YgiQ (UPF0313 family)